MPPTWPVPVEGGCACGTLRYRLDRTPMFIHCCNCHHCQRETGSAFALNAIVETDALVLLPPASTSSANTKSGVDESNEDKPSPKPKDNNEKPAQPKKIVLPSDSGFGQLHVKCPRCYITVWSYYAGSGPYSAFVKCGTLDKANSKGDSLEEILKPDIYIFTKFKQPWFGCPHDEETKAVEEFYDYFDTWSEEALERFKAVQAKSKAWREGGRTWDEAGDDVEDLAKEFKEMKVK